MGERPQT
jgi:hypothetical protein